MTLTLFDATREQIGEVLTGEPSYRIEQTWKGLYESFAEPENITTLSAALRKRLNEALPPALVPVRESVSDKGDTVKFLWHLADALAHRHECRRKRLVQPFAQRRRQRGDVLGLRE